MDYVPGSLSRGDRLRFSRHAWPITIDLVSTGSPQAVHTWTRLRVPYVRGAGLTFSVVHAGAGDAFARLLGIRKVDLEIGDPAFDLSFVVHASDEEKMRELLAAPELRRIFPRQPGAAIYAAEGRRYFPAVLPGDVDVLQITLPGVVWRERDLDQLVDLAGRILARMREVGAVADRDPRLLF